jgi:hypothetical protein
MNKSTVVRIPSSAADFFFMEAERQNRRFRSVVDGAVRAFAQLTPAQRDAFTIGEPLSDADRAKLGLKPAATVKPNRRKGGAL